MNNVYVITSPKGVFGGFDARHKATWLQQRSTGNVTLFNSISQAKIALNDLTSQFEEDLDIQKVAFQHIIW